MMSRRDVAGKVVLITGAAGGLGAALCRRYAAGGARIAALDLDAARLETQVAALRAMGAQALALPVDITDPGAGRAAVAAAVAHFGALDGLINNAGVSHRSLLQDTDPSVIRRVMEVNFFGAANLTLAALPHLVARRGFLVTISSVAGFSPLTGRTGYAASKHALHGFFDSLRSEVEGAGVAVTLVCPSFIASGIAAAATDGNGAPVSSQRLALGGESLPEDVAALIFDAVAEERELLLPDGTARKAWWLSRLAPRLYARIMKRRVGGEFAGLVKRGRRRDGGL
jgi:NAD(P)-dependent dehydrogenase (short-subunit alcohol dehydrogenase family)